MPRGKRSLTDLKERQFYRRVKCDPVSILTGESQPPVTKSTDCVPPAIRAPVNYAAPFDNANFVEILSNNKVPDCGSNYLDHGFPPADNRDPDHVTNGSAVNENAPAEVIESEPCCVSCLLCLCFVTCLICKHDHSGCHHCNECVNGDVPPDSDYEPISSDEEICAGVERFKLAEHSAANELNNECNNVRAEARSELAKWAVNNKIRHQPLGKLLKLLNTHYNADLPKDPRTLLHTPAEKVPVRSCPPGLYWHAGLERGLRALDLSNCHGKLEIDFGADGIPISNSSGSSFWPILCSVNSFDKIILVGAYHGNKKPVDANDFLRDFVDELKVLCRDGLIVDGKKIAIFAKCLIADAQGKSFMCKTTGVTGYCSCTKCTVIGVYVEGRVVFLDLSAPLRTNEDFRVRRQAEHHIGETILCELEDYDLVDEVVLDWMHLVLLGIVRKMLHLFKGGKLGVRFQSSLINEINELLELMRNLIPNDFGRKTRSLDYLKQFKATEFRLLILYVLPVVLVPLLKHGYVDRYQNVLVLHVALVIMASEYHLEHYGTEYPQKLCRAFVEGFLKIYGNEQASHNVHNLIHLPRDVANHGALDKFSAFRYENFLQELKKMVRKGEKPLQQLARRHMEAEAVGATKSVGVKQVEISGSCVFSGRPVSRCLLPQCGNPQYRCVIFPKFSLDVSPANRYCGLNCGKIVEIHNIAYQRDIREMVIVGKFFRTKVDFYEYPLPSSHLEIYQVSDLSELRSWPVSTVCRKYVCLPFKRVHVVFPILHTM